MDYGTLSGRGVLVSCEDGRIVASAVKEYSHGVMDKDLPEDVYKRQDPCAIYGKR